MDIAQPLLQAHDGLAIGMEAKMAGLDDAGVDRADGDLVQHGPGRLGREKSIGLGGGGP